MSQSLFDHIAATPVFNSKDVATPMSVEQIEKLRKKLFAEKRINVLPNRFNSKIPYQISTRWTDHATGDTTWTNYGRFKDLDAASYIGTVVGIAVYGAKALRGNFDTAKAVASEEVIAWLADARNQDCILLAQTNLDGTIGA